MAYADVTVIIDGAVEEEHTFSDEAFMLDYIRTIQDEAGSHGYLTEVYILNHEHSLTDDECGCVEYLQDHSPAYRFNAKD